MLGPMLVGVSALKFGALVRGAGAGRSSGTPNEMMSTILETSFATLSGRLAGNSLPTSFKLQRYIARANSGKRSCPDFVVSERVHIFIKSVPGSFDRSSKSLTFSPSRAWPSPTADLNNCSNFAWSVALRKERRIFGIFAPGAEARGAEGGGAGVDENDWAI